MKLHSVRLNGQAADSSDIIRKAKGQAADDATVWKAEKTDY